MKGPTKAKHPLIAFLVNAFAQKVFQPAPGAVQFRGPTSQRRRAKKTSYGQGLANHRAKVQRDRMELKDMHPQSDQHGAYTLTGNNPFTPRRVWLGGVSAKRGY